MTGIPFFRPKNTDKEMANCINCGKDYNIRSASIYRKGNEYFCSSECVLSYAEKWKND